MTGLAKLSARVGRNLMRYKPIAKVGMKLSKNKPEILAVTGGLLIVGGFVWAIWEAITVKDVMEETAQEVKAVEVAHQEQLAKEGRTEEEIVAETKEYNKDIKVARVRGSYKICKKFVGPVLMLAGGLSSVGGSVKIFRLRNAFLGTALKSSESFIKSYRQNVRDDIGEEADKKYARGIIGEKEIEKKQLDVNGNETVVKRKVPIVKHDSNNPWRFEFSEELFDTYQENTDSNLFYLKCVQDWWNHEVHRYKRISMYDILKYMRFRFDVMRQGMTKKQYVDWEYSMRNSGWWERDIKDDPVDLGIYNAINEAALRRESDVIFLEPNCFGSLSDEWHE